MLIKINSQTGIDADEVAEVKIAGNGTMLRVRTRDGRDLPIDVDYRKDVYAELDRWIERINDAKRHTTDEVAA